MTINIEEGDLKQGVMGLVLALVEVIRDAMKLQALKRMDAGSLTEEETERLGKALMDLDKAIDEIKKDYGVEEAVGSIRADLDKIASDVLNKLANPEEWAKGYQNGKDERQVPVLRS